LGGAELRSLAYAYKLPPAVTNQMERHLYNYALRRRPESSSGSTWARDTPECSSRRITNDCRRLSWRRSAGLARSSVYVVATAPYLVYVRPTDDIRSQPAITETESPGFLSAYSWRGFIATLRCAVSRWRLRMSLRFQKISANTNLKNLGVLYFAKSNIMEICSN